MACRRVPVDVQGHLVNCLIGIVGTKQSAQELDVVERIDRVSVVQGQNHLAKRRVIRGFVC